MSVRPYDVQSSNRAVWTAGLVVAIAAAIATAHGLYEVAHAAGAPVPIAALYPVISDGLALVAYVTTMRVDAVGRRYAWTIVVLAAGLSGLAQAAYLAGGVASAPTALRAGVGAWPALAAALVAHLLSLLNTASYNGPYNPSNALYSRTTGVEHPNSPLYSGPSQSAATDVAGGGADAHADVPSVGSSSPSDPLHSRTTSAAHLNGTLYNGTSHAAGSDAAGAGPDADPDAPSFGSSSRPNPLFSRTTSVEQLNGTLYSGPYNPAATGAADATAEPETDTSSGGSSSPSNSPSSCTAGAEHLNGTLYSGPYNPTASEPSAESGEAVAPARDRARDSAQAWAQRHGALPSVTELAATAQVARGTAAAALRALRADSDTTRALPLTPQAGPTDEPRPPEHERQPEEQNPEPQRH